MDLLRAVAIIAVAAIHCGAWLAPPNAPPDSGVAAAIVGIARFSVPVFVFASGALLFRSYGGRPVGPRQFLRKRFMRVLIPWLLWAPLFLLWDAWQSGIRLNSPGSVASWFAFGGGHLYFLLLIAQLYLVFLAMPRTRGKLLAFVIGSLALQLGLGWLHTHGPSVSGSLVWPATYLAGEEAPYWIGYFALGCFAGSMIDSILALSRFWPAAVAAVCLTIPLLLWEAGAVPLDSWRLGSYVFLWPSLAPLTVALALLIVWLGRALGSRLAAAWPAIQGLSKHSLGIYVLHQLPLALLGPLTSPIPGVVRLPLLMFLCLSFGYVVVLALVRTRLGALALGETPAKLPTPDSAGRIRAAPKVLA